MIPNYRIYYVYRTVFILSYEIFSFFLKWQYMAGAGAEAGAGAKIRREKKWAARAKIK